MNTEEFLRLLKAKADSEGIGVAFPSFSAEQVAEAESEMELKLPELLKHVLTIVAGSGIAPAAQMMDLSSDIGYDGTM